MATTVETSPLLIGGSWVEGEGERADVLNPYDGSVVGTVPMATPAEVEAAIRAAERGFQAMAAWPAHRRAALG